MVRTQKSEKLAITMQFHARRGTVYEFECRDSKLSIHMSPRQALTDAGDWRVEAAASHGTNDLPIVKWGATRAETLQEVGRTWNVEGAIRGLPNFDWDEVARLLTTVSAL